MSHFNKTLHSVTPPVLNDLADHVETFAHQLRRVANNNERRCAIKAASIDFRKIVGVRLVRSLGGHMRLPVG